jgi:hypothetical protein
LSRLFGTFWHARRIQIEEARCLMHPVSSLRQ